MRGGVKALCLATALSGCAGGPRDLEIRPRDPSAALRTSRDSVALAWGQLAVGNVGLAIEGFRKAARDRPDSPEPFRGLASCYERMGRLDLARTNYEAALAIAPDDPALLNAFAALLERRGQSAEAASARAEAARFAPPKVPLIAKPVAPPVAVLANAAPLPVPVAAPAGPPKRAAPVAKLAVPDIHPARPPSVVAPVPPPQPAARVTPQVVAAVTPQKSVPATSQQVAPASLPKPAPSVTVALPPARPVVAERKASSPPALTTVAQRPKLERMSPGEVALLTQGGPAWRPVVVAQSRQSTTVRFVPLKTFALRPNIRLLNAGRREGMAAQARNYLLQRGWRRIEIGDSPRPRDTSIVLYPVEHAVIGRRLAAQFGIRSSAARSGREFLVLLGRDAARKAPTRLRG